MKSLLPKIQKYVTCIFGIVLLLSISACGRATNPALTEASSLYEKGYFADAFDIWHKEAQAGVAEAQFNLSTLYYSGKGVDRDTAKGYDWLSKAADQEYAPALHNMALQLLEREKTKSAFDYLVKAADQHFPASLYTLGKFHQAGLEGREEPELAFRYISKAAAMGFDKAQYNLGKMYRDGYGVKRSETTSTAWFKRAAFQGYKKAQAKLVSRYFKGRGVSVDTVEALKWYLISGKGNVLDGDIKPFLSHMTPEEKKRAEKAAKSFTPIRE